VGARGVERDGGERRALAGGAEDDRLGASGGGAARGALGGGERLVVEGGILVEGAADVDGDEGEVVVRKEVAHLLRTLEVGDAPQGQLGAFVAGGGHLTQRLV